MSITIKRFKDETKKILDYFNIEIRTIKTSSDGATAERFCIDTIYGDYYFYFADNDTIFGKFQDIEKLNRIHNKNNCFGIDPNLYSGKMNFHFNHVLNFIDILDHLVLKK